MQPNSDASGRGDLSIGELDLHLFAEGKHRHCMNFLGAHVVQGNGVNGTRFAVWKPQLSSKMTRFMTRLIARYDPLRLVTTP